jgi:hypothetical protein
MHESIRSARKLVELSSRDTKGSPYTRQGEFTSFEAGRRGTADRANFTRRAAGLDRSI